MTCSLENGGNVTLAASANKKVSLSFDSLAQSALGTRGDSNLSAMLELVSSGELTGPIDFLEIGKGYAGKSDRSRCGMGLDFAAGDENDAQNLVGDREIPLKPVTNGAYGYRSVTCGERTLRVEKCFAAPGINQVVDFKRYLKQIEGD